MGLAEIAVIAILGLLVFGPDKLPNAIKTLVAGVRSLRDAAGDASRSLQEAAGLDSEDARKTMNDLADLHPKRLMGSILDDPGGRSNGSAAKKASAAPLNDYDPDAP